MQLEKMEKMYENCLNDLAEFYQWDIALIKLIMSNDNAVRLNALKWNECNPISDEDKENFYKRNTYYPLDLCNWHVNNRQKMRFDFALVKTLLRDNRKTVLDFGCGIGWNGLMCSAAGMNVVLADFASPQLDYARHLAAVYKLPVRFWELDKKPLWDGSRFDTIFIFDTLEHTVDPVKVALQIKDLLSKGGKVYATTSFGKTENHPMHENLSPDAKRAIEIIQELT